MNNKKHLITQDLISSVDWALKAPSTKIKDREDGLTWQQKALQDLVDKLNRVSGDFPIAAQRGVDFEKKVYKCVNNNTFDIGSEPFQEVCKALKGYDFQSKIKHTETIGGYNCFLYGKLDADPKTNTKPIIDIKTTQGFSKDKYKQSFQAKLYCYVNQNHNFTFIVVEWLDYPTIKKVHYVNVRFEDLFRLRELVHEKILSTLQTLKDMDLWEIYRDKYCLY